VRVAVVLFAGGHGRVGVADVGLGTRMLRNENERSVGMLAFISCTNGATSKC